MWACHPFQPALWHLPVQEQSVGIQSDKNTNYTTGYVLSGGLGEALSAKHTIKAMALALCFVRTENEALLGEEP